MKKKFVQFISLISSNLPLRVKNRLYKLGPLTIFIRKFLNQITPIGMTEVRISAGGNRGIAMELDLQTEKDYWLGTYEIDLQDVLIKLTQNGWCAYDVGANIGFFTLLFSNLVGKNGLVYSFEPLPSNLKRLQKNLYLNGLQDVVKIVPAAIHNMTKEITFLVGASCATGKIDGSMGREIDRINNDPILVQGISLDDFVYEQKHPKPKVIKMDIEGGEVLALQGMTRVLREIKPLLFLELHGYTASKIAWNILSSFGYNFYRITSGLDQVKSVEELDWKSYLVAMP